MRRILTALAAAVLALTLLTACPEPNSCGRKDISRYNHDGTVDHCKNGKWVRER
jgi:hypothetical protein